MKKGNIYNGLKDSFSARLDRAINENELYGGYEVIVYDDGKAYFVAHNTCALYEYAEPECTITRIDVSFEELKAKARLLSESIVDSALSGEEDKLVSLLSEYKAIFDERAFLMRLPLQGIFPLSESDRKKVTNILFENELFTSYLKEIGKSFQKNESLLVESMPFLGLRARDKLIKFFQSQIGLTYEQSKLLTNGLLNTHLGQHLTERFEFKNLFRSFASHMPPQKAKKLTFLVLETIMHNLFNEAQVISASDYASDPSLKGKTLSVSKKDLDDKNVEGIKSAGEFSVVDTDPQKGTIKVKDGSGNEAEIRLKKNAIQKQTGTGINEAKETEKEEEDDEDVDKEEVAIKDLDDDTVDDINATSDELTDMLKDAKAFLESLKKDGKKANLILDDEEEDRLEQTIQGLEDLIEGEDHIGEEDTESKENKDSETAEELVQDEEIVGGLGDELSPSELNPDELEMGIATEEEEHVEKNTKLSGEEKRRVAEDIAKDHLAEDPNYYTKLDKFEKQFKGKEEKGPEGKVEEGDKTEDEPKDEVDVPEEEQDEDFDSSQIKEEPSKDSEIIPDEKEAAPTPPEDEDLFPGLDLDFPDEQEEDEEGLEKAPEIPDLSMSDFDLEIPEETPEPYDDYLLDSEIMIGDTYDINKKTKGSLIDINTGIAFPEGYYIVMDVTPETIIFLDENGNKFFANREDVLSLEKTYSPLKENVSIGELYELQDIEMNEEQKVKDLNSGDILPPGFYLIHDIMDSEEGEGQNIKLVKIDEANGTDETTFIVPLAAMRSFIKSDADFNSEDENIPMPPDNLDDEEEMRESRQLTEAELDVPDTPFEEEEIDTEEDTLPKTPFEETTNKASGLEAPDELLKEPDSEEKPIKDDSPIETDKGTKLLTDEKKPKKQQTDEDVNKALKDLDNIPDPKDYDLVSDLDTPEIDDAGDDLSVTDEEKKEKEPEVEIKIHPKEEKMELEEPELPSGEGDDVTKAGDLADMSEAPDAEDEVEPVEVDGELGDTGMTVEDIDSEVKRSEENTEKSDEDKEVDVDSGNIPSSFEDIPKFDVNDPTGKFGADKEAQFFYKKLDDLANDIHSKKEQDSSGYQSGVELGTYLDLIDSFKQKLAAESDAFTKEQAKEFLSFFIPEEELSVIIPDPIQKKSEETKEQEKKVQKLEGQEQNV